MARFAGTKVEFGADKDEFALNVDTRELPLIHADTNLIGPPPSRSTEKSWPHFRPSAVDFCGSRLAIGAATERARALAMPAGTRAQVYKRDSSGVAPASPQVGGLGAELRQRRICPPRLKARGLGGREG
jgi:hypothetical protein